MLLIKCRMHCVPNERVSESVSHQVFDASQHRCGGDACEEGHEVQAGEGPD